MRVPTILPASYPDTIADLQNGATFFLDPQLDGVCTSPHVEGVLFLATAKYEADRRVVVRLEDGVLIHCALNWAVRAVATSAETDDSQW